MSLNLLSRSCLIPSRRLPAFSLRKETTHMNNVPVPDCGSTLAKFVNLRTNTICGNRFLKIFIHILDEN